MEHKEYNGWTNYETRNVALWMDNDEGSQGYWNERAEECVKVDAEDARISLADIMKEQYEEQSQDLLENAGVQCSVWADLLGAALSEVNWIEIAEHYIDAVEVETEEEETETT